MRQAFAPVAAANARTLILGSMPGITSLDADQYYAHPRNAFWSIMQHITGIAATAPYQDRVKGLLHQRIALWDVLRACKRQGSLDSNINQSCIVVNNFDAFFSDHPEIERILLNGGMAFRLFNRHALKMHAAPNQIAITPCPSTSPAHARLGLQQKINIWLNALA